MKPPEPWPTPKRQPPDVDRLDHIEQAQMLIDVQPPAADPLMVALAQAHATIAVAQALRSILAVLKTGMLTEPDINPPKPTQTHIGPQ